MPTTSPPSPPAPGFSLVAYLRLFRFPLVFTAVADSVSGYLLLVKKADLLIMGLLAASSACLYAFGMGMNDIADRKRDLEIAPTRVLPSDKVSLRGAIIGSFLALGLSLAALLCIPRQPVLQRLPIWGLILVFILVYDFLVRIPPAMGMVRACNLAMGLLVAWNGFGRRSLGYDATMVAVVALPELLYVTALTFVSRQEEGTVQRWKVFVGAFIMILALTATVHWIPAVHYGSIRSPYSFMVEMDQSEQVWWGLVRYFQREFKPVVPALIPALLLSGWLIYRATRARNRKAVALFVRDGVAGIILLDATLVMSAGAIMPGFWISALLGPSIWLLLTFKSPSSAPSPAPPLRKLKSLA